MQGLEIPCTFRYTMSLGARQKTRTPTNMGPQPTALSIMLIVQKKNEKKVFFSQYITYRNTDFRYKVREFLKSPHGHHHTPKFSLAWRN